MDRSDEMRSVAALVERLGERFPQFSGSTIEEAVSSVHSQLADAPIRDFVPVLVEHEVVDALKARARAGQVGEP
jgi:hypothetical protein